LTDISAMIYLMVISFGKNQADFGGAIHLNNSSPLLNNLYFSDNSAASYGGVFYAYSTNVSIKNCNFTANTAGFGGVLYSDNSQISVQNCILNSNLVDEAGSILACKSSSVFLQNYPNPFNNKTIISYQLSNPSHVDLNIYNILGQKIRMLVSKKRPEGVYEVTWDGQNSHGLPVSSGIYFYRLKTKKFVKTKKMVLVR